MNHISRKPTNQIHPALFRIKALFSLILNINNPNLSDTAAALKADWLSVQCVNHLVNKETFLAFTQFCQAKGIENEPVSAA